MPGAEVLSGDSFDDEPEAGPEAGDAHMLERAESVDLGGESSGFRRPEFAQQIQERIRVEEVEDAPRCARYAGHIDRLDQPQQVGLGGGATDTGIARLPFTLDQTVGDAGGGPQQPDPPGARRFDCRWSLTLLRLLALFDPEELIPAGHRTSTSCGVRTTG